MCIIVKTNTHAHMYIIYTGWADNMTKTNGLELTPLEQELGNQKIVGTNLDDFWLMRTTRKRGEPKASANQNTYEHVYAFLGSSHVPRSDPSIV